MKIGITGKRSSITEAFVSLLAPETEIVYGNTATLPKDLDQYFLCAGVLVGKEATAMSDEEAYEMLKVNFIDVVRFCDDVIKENDRAQICVMGSHSGVKGSFDTVYAGSKASLHLYVETKKLLHKDQHLVCVAPTIIEDSGMTKRRTDLSEALERGKARRLGRWLNAAEVARTAHFAINEPALANSVVHMTGGTW